MSKVWSLLTAPEPYVFASFDEEKTMEFSFVPQFRNINTPFTLLRLMALTLVMSFSSIPGEIYPENIGGTQYATGHLAAASKLIKGALKLGNEWGWTEEKTTMIFGHAERLLLTQRGEGRSTLQRLNLSTADRTALIKLLAGIQDQVSQKSPLLFMIGEQRAVATDGHHRVRALGKLNEIMHVSSALWPDETSSVLNSLGRVNKSGAPITALAFKSPTVVETLPADVNATELMRSILKNEMGLWEDPKDDRLARFFYGKEVKKAPDEVLKYLASKLGIVDEKSSVSFRPVLDLPDSPNRTLMGLYFESRGLKDRDISFRTYVEFYVGDRVRKIAQKYPERFPNLIKFLDPSTTMAEQKVSLEVAMSEVDEMFIFKEKLTKETIEHTAKGSKKLEKILTRIRASACNRSALSFQ